MTRQTGRAAVSARFIPRCSVASCERRNTRYRFSLDAELGQHFDNKTDAEKAANAIRTAIVAGTFERAADRRAREEREAVARAAGPAVDPSIVTFDQFAKTYIERGPQASGKTSW